MPEVMFRVRWPDGAVESCYSPSTVITRFFEAGHDYSLDDFLARARNGLNAASDRVAQRYGGSGCSHARAQLAAIEAKAKGQSGLVRIVGFAE